MKYYLINTFFLLETTMDVVDEELEKMSGDEKLEDKKVPDKAAGWVAIRIYLNYLLIFRL